MKNDYKHRTWRAAFATQTNNNSLLLEKYDYYVATHHDAQKTFECLAGGSDEVMSVSQKIAHSLELAAQNNVETNPVVRVRKAINVFNANVSKCNGIEIVGGVPDANLAEHQRIAVNECREQRKRLKQSVPKVFSKPTPLNSLTSVGSFQGKAVTFEVSW